MCLWSKPKPTPPAPQFDRLAMTITPTPLYNSTHEGPVAPVFGCPTPSVPCTVDSQFYDGYCDNGICCSNKHIGEDFCACFESHFSGTRCDMHRELLHPTTAASAPAALIVSGLAVIVIVVIAVILIFLFMKWRRRNAQRNRDSTDAQRQGNISGHSSSEPLKSPAPDSAARDSSVPTEMKTINEKRVLAT